MDDPDDARLAAAVKALYRIRAVEKPPDAGGLREVWHQCAQGADLVSFVDPKGHLVHQELTLVGSYFRWTSRDGLCTGSFARVRGPKTRHAGEAIVLDLQVAPDRVLRAHKALSGYDGPDRYLRHLLQVMELAARGLPWHEEPTVTRVLAPGEGALGEPSRAPEPRPWNTRWGLAAGAAMLLSAFLCLVYFLLRLHPGS